VGGYILQSKASMREKKWAAETEAKRIADERENERARRKHELISKRLNIVEEAATLFMFLIEIEFDETVGLPVFSESEILQEKRRRIEELSLLAHPAVKVLGSPELQTSFLEMSSVFWDSTQNPGIRLEDYEKASAAYAKVIRIIDEMRLNSIKD